MFKTRINAFNGKNILLLQGPVGPFFKRLSRDLEANNAVVHKVNFNGGDWLFYPTKSISFHGSIDDWPDFFDQLLSNYSIDVIMFFGDCRVYHRIAHEIAHLRGIEIAVFEEGYIRPDYITLERFGTNNNSLMPREILHYENHIPNVPPKTIEIGKTFGYAAMWAMLYYFACTLLWPFYLHYNHHRPLNIFEGLYWVRAFWRKQYFAHMEKNELQDLINQYNHNFFLVPLQVHNDAQIYFHSHYASVKDFISSIILSFSGHAPKDTLLIIKHHPLDRGYHDYTKHIKKIARLNGVENRVRYIHDQHLPTLFNHVRGVITVNSTVGLSAIHHNVPVKVCGKALYDLSGLTFQGSLEQFWQQAPLHAIDRSLYFKYLNYLIDYTQLNGSFYKRIDHAVSHAGIM